LLNARLEEIGRFGFCAGLRRPLSTSYKDLNGTRGNGC